MRSRLYECKVMHHRFSPKVHRFSYRIFLFAFDLDELEALDQNLRLFSVGRGNLYSFHDGDYLPTNEAKCQGTARVISPDTSGVPPARVTLKRRVLAYLAAQEIDLAGGRIELITMPRVAGYLFNPVSFFFCYDRTGTCVAAIPEVTNTFREMKPFLLGPDARTVGPETGPQQSASDRPPGSSSSDFLAATSPPSCRVSPLSFQKRVPKHFYVSPFSDVDVAFDFNLRPPAAGLSIQIDDYVGTTRTLTSTLTGHTRPLTDGALAWLTFRYPLLPLHTISRIHWHALRLWLKRVPWFAKAARASDQRELYRPHHSILPPVSPDLPSDAA